MIDNRYYHPISAVYCKIQEFLKTRGFDMFDTSDVSTIESNFDVVDVPNIHPARRYEDIFFLNEGFILSKHYSSMQYEIMLKNTLPIKAMYFGKAYRNIKSSYEADNVTYQFEGFSIGRNCGLATLFGLISDVLDVLEIDNKYIIMSKFFPYAEPGYCVQYQEKYLGDRFAESTKRINLCSCGIIHPNLLKKAHIDTSEYIGISFCFNVSQLARIIFKIEDVRMMHE
ncbi:MAG: hypothetical protein R3Y32_00065 [Bacillota bacterium]